jgi:hypothetical protein
MTGQKYNLFLKSPNFGEVLWVIQYDSFELAKKAGELGGTLAMENTEDGGDLLELDRF